MKRLTPWLAVVFLAVVLAGCGTKTELDKVKVQKFLSEHLHPQPKSLDCPEGITSKAGVTFDCKVAYDDGDQGTVTVHVTDDKGFLEVGPEDLHIQK